MVHSFVTSLRTARDEPRGRLVATADDHRPVADCLGQGQRRAFPRRGAFREQELIQLRKTRASLIDIGQVGDEGDEFVDLFPSAHDDEAVFDFTSRGG